MIDLNMYRHPILSISPAIHGGFPVPRGARGAECCAGIKTQRMGSIWQENSADATPNFRRCHPPGRAGGDAPIQPCREWSGADLPDRPATDRRPDHRPPDAQAVAGWCGQRWQNAAWPVCRQGPARGLAPHSATRAVVGRGQVRADAGQIFDLALGPGRCLRAEYRRRASRVWPVRTANLPLLWAETSRMSEYGSFRTYFERCFSKSRRIPIVRRKLCQHKFQRSPAMILAGGHIAARCPSRALGQGRILQLDRSPISARHSRAYRLPGPV